MTIKMADVNIFVTGLQSDLSARAMLVSSWLTIQRLIAWILMNVLPLVSVLIPV